MSINCLATKSVSGKDCSMKSCWNIQRQSVFNLLHMCHFGFHTHTHTYTHRDTKRTCGAMEIFNKVLIWVVEGLCDNYDPNKVKKVLKYFF